MKVYYEDPACDPINEYILLQSHLLVGLLRDLLRKKRMSCGIQWPKFNLNVNASGTDNLVLAYAKLTKVTDQRSAFINENQCDMYWLLLRRFFPGPMVVDVDGRFVDPDDWYLVF